MSAFDTETQLQLVASLKMVETHMTYLREEVSKITDVQDTLQEMKIGEVEQRGEFKAMRESNEDLSRKLDLLNDKIEGQPGTDPLPSRVKNLEGRIHKMEGPRDADPIPSRLKALEGDMVDLKADIKSMVKSDTEMRKERLKAWVSIALALVAMVGGTVSALIGLFNG